MVGTITPRTNRERVALYRTRKAEDRPRDNGRRFHLRDEEFRDYLEPEPYPVISPGSSPILDTPVHRQTEGVPDEIVNQDSGKGVSLCSIDGRKVLGEVVYKPSCIYPTDHHGGVYEGAPPASEEELSHEGRVVVDQRLILGLRVVEGSNRKIHPRRDYTNGRLWTLFTAAVDPMNSKGSTSCPLEINLTKGDTIIDPILGVSRNARTCTHFSMGDFLEGIGKWVQI